MQFYSSYDKVLSTYMGVAPKGIGLDLTVVRAWWDVGGGAHEQHDSLNVLVMAATEPVCREGAVGQGR